MDTRVVFVNLKACRQINGIAVSRNQVRVLGNPDCPLKTTKRTRSAWIRGAKEGIQRISAPRIATSSPGRPVLGPGSRLHVHYPKMAAGLALLTMAAMAVGRSSDASPPAQPSVSWKYALSAIPALSPARFLIF